MALGDPINVRLDDSVRAVLERQAAAQGVPFSVFLRSIITAGSEAGERAGGMVLEQRNESPMLAEILLLLREASSPDRLRRVHAELKRNGMTPWQSGGNDGR